MLLYIHAIPKVKHPQEQFSCWSLTLLKGFLMVGNTLVVSLLLWVVTGTF